MTDKALKSVEGIHMAFWKKKAPEVQIPADNAEIIDLLKDIRLILLYKGTLCEEDLQKLIDTN